eukprot:4676349-Amphidinium_carterae.1
MAQVIPTRPFLCYCFLLTDSIRPTVRTVALRIGVGPAGQLPNALRTLGCRSIGGCCPGKQKTTARLKAGVQLTTSLEINSGAPQV